MENSNTEQSPVEEIVQTPTPIQNTAHHGPKKITFWIAILVLVAVGSFLFVKYYIPIYKIHQKEKVIESLKEEGVYQTEEQKKEVIKNLNSSPVLNENDWSKVIQQLNKK
ncbi:MAG: hypothetical protein WCO58_01950 [bacterium]